jgi:glyoxylase-like metal-dependent hydrolase (beta-lactamase superfamily II)
LPATPGRLEVTAVLFVGTELRLGASARPTFGECVSNKVTHIVYSHHHADHIGASSLFRRSTAFIILESMRLDLGVGIQIHP